MFYIKHRGEKIEITGEVYTTCPRCGREHELDLHYLLRDGDADLFGTSVYCKACAKELREGMPGYFQPTHAL